MTSAEVPASDASGSGQLLEDPERSSVYDFLYHDARRVGSFLAQFETHGVPSQTKATESTGRSAATRTSTGGDFGVPAVMKAQASIDSTVTEDERDAAERTFDPLWTNARTLLNYLTERGLIQRDLWDARLGQFVLASGALIVLDVAMFKSAWDKPAVKKLAIASAVGGTPASGRERKSGHDGSKSDAQLLIEMLSLFPHSIQAHLLGTNYGVWCSFAEASLVGASSDVVLKHGSFVPGEWHMLGILDAFPDVKQEPTSGEAVSESVDEAVASSVGTMIGKLTAQLAPVARELLGRPRTSFGMTPLLIFREVLG